MNEGTAQKNIIDGALEGLRSMKWFKESDNPLADLGLENSENQEALAKLDWAPYDEEVSRRIRNNLKIMTLGAAVIFGPPGYANYKLAMMLNMPEFFWYKLAVRVPTILAYFAIFLIVRSSLKITRKQALGLLYVSTAVWVAFFMGLLITTAMSMPEDRPERLPNAIESMFGTFGMMCLISLLFPLTFQVMFAIGATATAMFLAAHLFSGILSASALIGFSAFLIGTTVFVSFGARANDRLRRREYALRATLSQNNAQLKELDQLKTKFFSNISHELRTPLTMILVPLEGILAGRESSSMNFLKSVGANARRLLRQVNLILDFSKIEAGKMNLKLSTSNLGELVQELINAAGPHSEKCGITLKAEGLDQMPTTDFDVNKMEIVAANLLSNAMKFTPPGGTITVRMQNTGKSLVVEFQDTGPGIPADQIGKLFQRFSQIDDPSSKRQSGTGLGLAMVREFSRLHGGDATVTSVVGQGSTFRVEIPHRPQDVLKESNQSVEITYEGSHEVRTPQTNTVSRETLLLSDIESGVKETESELQEVQIFNENTSKNFDKNRSTVLYTDDNKGLRDYVSSFLQKEYNVYLATNGKQGLEVAMEVRPDLILSDLMMPLVSGIEFCELVRESTELKETPFVLLTARGALDSKLEGLSSGADDYLNKPFSEQEVLARLKNLIELRKSQLHNKREMLRARQIQQSLLPKPQQVVQGFNFDFLYRSCEVLSGDFYDLEKVSDGVVFYLADITSHGVAAAQVTYLMKGIFKNILSESKEVHVAEIAKRIAKDFAAYNLPYSISLFLGYLKNDGALEFMSSNFQSPILLTQDKAVFVDVPRNPVIDGESFDDSIEFKTSTIELDPSQTLFVFSDGAVELQDPKTGQLLGQRRILRMLQECDKKSDWQDALIAHLASIHGNSSFPDDITVLRLKKAK